MRFSSPSRDAKRSKTVAGKVCRKTVAEFLGALSLPPHPDHNAKVVESAGGYPMESLSRAKSMSCVFGAFTPVFGPEFALIKDVGVP